MMQVLSAPNRESPSRISVMIVGDSISQGHEGDWTWRYRIWQWFQTEEVEVDFVGPFTGTHPLDPTGSPAPESRGSPDEAQSPDSGGYHDGVTPGWGSKHFSLWGQNAAQVKVLIKPQIAKYTPDYLFLELGFNDIGWFVSDPAGTLSSMKSIVTNARAANPNINFAIADVPQRTPLGDINADLPERTAKYNKMLAKALPEWSTASSKVQLVNFQENYECGPDGCPAGYDGLHPNALGEYQIAQAFSRTLIQGFGIGKRELVVPGNVRQFTPPLHTEA